MTLRKFKGESSLPNRFKSDGAVREFFGIVRTPQSPSACLLTSARLAEIMFVGKAVSFFYFFFSSLCNFSATIIYKWRHNACNMQFSWPVEIEVTESVAGCSRFRWDFTCNCSARLESRFDLNSDLIGQFAGPYCFVIHQLINACCVTCRYGFCAV